MVTVMDIMASLPVHTQLKRFLSYDSLIPSHNAEQYDSGVRHTNCASLLAWLLRLFAGWDNFNTPRF